MRGHHLMPGEVVSGSGSLKTYGSSMDTIADPYAPFVRSHLLVVLRGLLLATVRVKIRQGRVHYYTAIAKGCLATLLRREPVDPKEFLSRELWAEYDGQEYLLTRETVFAYFLHVFEPQTADILRSLHGDLFIDVGANVGQYAIPLSRNFRKVVAIEPNPISYRVLEANIARNKLSNIEVVHSAVTAHKGSVWLMPGSHLTTWAVKDDGPPGSEVPSVTLDEVLLNFPQVDLMKVDIEGRELEVLLSSKLLPRVKHISFSCEPRHYPLILPSLRQSGFSIFVPPSRLGLAENVNATSREEVRT